MKAEPKISRKNYAVECEICLERFNTVDREPIKICSNTHLMCVRCFNSKYFRIDENGNKTLCPFCPEKVNSDKPKPYKELKIALQILEILTIEQPQDTIRFILDQVRKQQIKLSPQTIAYEIFLQNNDIENLKKDLSQQRKSAERNYKEIQEFQILTRAYKKQSIQQQRQIQELRSEVTNLKAQITAQSETIDVILSTQKEMENQDKEINEVMLKERVLASESRTVQNSIRQAKKRQQTLVQEREVFKILQKDLKKRL